MLMKKLYILILKNRIGSWCQGLVVLILFGLCSKILIFFLFYEKQNAFKWYANYIDKKTILHVSINVYAMFTFKALNR